MDGDGALAESEVESTYVACTGPSNCDIDVEYPGNLVACELPGADLHDRRFDGNFMVAADLSGANLSGASCGSVNMEDMPSGYCHLECADLSGADLSSANLYVPILRGADLTGAIFTGASMFAGDLGGVIAADAELSGVDLTRGHLEGADLRGANLAGADLSHADTFGLVACPAVLPDAIWLCASIVRPPCGEPSAPAFMLLGPSISLEGRDLSAQDLSGANLRAANLQHTRLVGARLLGATLAGANLYAAQTAELASCPATGADEWLCVAQPALATFALVGPGATLSHTDFTNADLSGANLFGANLVSTRLANADLSGADLRSADLSGAYGEPASVAGALTDSSTLCYDHQPGPCW